MKVFIDTDCGVDDAIALIMGSKREDIEILGISTVSGNVHVDQATENVLKILTFLDKDIPVFKGATKPLVQKLVTAEAFHGPEGLGRAKFPKPNKREEKIRAPEGLYEIARENKGLNLITLGPLTNIAIALNLYPDLKNYLGNVYIMGGAIETGNITRFAEFNLYTDPEASEVVLSSGLDITLLTWDATIKAPFFEEELLEIIPRKDELSKIFWDLIGNSIDYIEKILGMRATLFPDPLCMVTSWDKKLIKRMVLGKIKMELNYNTMRGASILTEGEDVKIIMDVDKEVFKKYLINTFN
ncbi:MAG: nucleoside hydrolase [Dictyoglomaceae bacterium]